LKHLQSRSIWY